MTAAQHTYHKAKALSAQPRHKPWVDSECRSPLHSYKEAEQGPSGHVAKIFFWRFRSVVRGKKHHHTQHVAAKLADLAKEDPPKFWKRFRQKGRTLPVADVDKWSF